MTSVSKYTPASTLASSTASFGTHRHADRPASALRAGASSMPAAWQTRGVASYGARHQFDAPARTIFDIAKDPFRWLVSTRVHQIMTALAVSGLALITLL